MTWKDGNLICDWCKKIVIPHSDVTGEDIEANKGWTKCYDCCMAAKPLNQSGPISELLSGDFFAPDDPSGKFFRGEITLEQLLGAGYELAVKETKNDRA